MQSKNSKLCGHPVDLLPDALAAFEQLKMKCLTVLVLAFADFQKPFLLETDASIKLEFLALKWVITEQFKEYLQYQSFKVKTDNNPITYVMMMPNLDALRHRWVAVMAGYNFDIEYLKGLENKVTDALSWVGQCLDEETIKEILSHGTCVPQAKADYPYVL